MSTPQFGTGRPVLLLHGGAGPQSMLPFAERFAAEHDVRTIVPTHPGFAGTEREPGVTDIRGLAGHYDRLVDELELQDAAVVGNSIGGWIAAELAALGSERISGLVIVDAAGLVVEGHPVADFFSLELAQVADLSYADPDRFRIDPAALPPAAQAAMASSRAALRDYAGTAMVDPTLGERLAKIDVPTLVVWGDADRVIEPEVGEAYADAIQGARYVLMPRTGHLPQVETPEEFGVLLADFLGV